MEADIQIGASSFFSNKVQFSPQHQGKNHKKSQVNAALFYDQQYAALPLNLISIQFPYLLISSSDLARASNHDNAQQIGFYFGRNIREAKLSRLFKARIILRIIIYWSVFMEIKLFLQMIQMVIQNHKYTVNNNYNLLLLLVGKTQSKFKVFYCPKL